MKRYQYFREYNCREMMAAATVSRRVLITGGTKGGLGWEAARQLLDSGHDVVLTFRDQKKAREAVDALVRGLKPVAGNSSADASRVQWVELDLSSLSSVRSSSEEILRRFPSLDVLLLNAGMVPSGNAPQATQDGWEATYQTNHLSHFLLVHLILPALLASKAPGGSRIVVVSSELHRLGPKSLPASPSYLHNIMQQQQQQQQRWAPLQIYALSKLYNLWFCYKLSALLKEAQLPVTTDAVTPGWVPSSNLGLSGPGWWTWWTRLLMHNVLPLLPITVSLQEGARRLADVAAGSAAQPPSSPEAAAAAAAVAAGSHGARYFTRGAPRPSSEASYDEAKQDELWDLSMQATGISGSYLPSPKSSST